MRSRRYSEMALHGPADPASSSGAERVSGQEAQAHGAGQPLERTVRDRGERLTEHAAAMAREVREGGAEFVAHGRDTVAHYLSSFARALGRAAESLEQDHEGKPARYVREGYQALDDWANKVRTREPDDLVHDLGTLSRRQPALVLGGFALLGVMAARFLKASSERAERRHSYRASDGDAHSDEPGWGAAGSSSYGSSTLGSYGSPHGSGSSPVTTGATGSGPTGGSSGSFGYGGATVEKKPGEV